MINKKKLKNKTPTYKVIKKCYLCSMEIRRINNGKIFYFGNDVIPKYSFNAKELDEETGMYYFEARYYRAPVFISRDPLMNEKPWLTPYHYCSNNPVGRIDPTGCEDWEPEVTKDGKVSYVAEKGDNMTTFRKQYGLDAKTAGTILGRSGITKDEQIVAGKTSISGETVEGVTGSDVLKMDWDSEQATTQKKADQLMFAIKYSQQISQSDLVDLKDFFTNIGGVKGITNLSNISINVGNGERIPVKNIALGISGWTTLRSSGESPDNIDGTDDFKHEYRSTVNPKNIRSTMSMRISNQYKDKYIDYYYNLNSYYK